MGCRFSDNGMRNRWFDFAWIGAVVYLLQRSSFALRQHPSL
ncbi:hypothetical protein MHY1_00501 [Methylovirgula sp. HY1]|nr:hypothetical protein MHY1_00501 [Methylovirgula sp. HY1]